MPKFFDRVKFLVVLVVSFALMTLPKLALAGPGYEETTNFDWWFSVIYMLIGVMMFVFAGGAQKSNILRVVRVALSLFVLFLSWHNVNVPKDMDYMYLVNLFLVFTGVVVYILTVPGVMKELIKDFQTDEDEPK